MVLHYQESLNEISRFSLNLSGSNIPSGLALIKYVRCGINPNSQDMETIQKAFQFPFGTF